jgi:hypothetical protein
MNLCHEALDVANRQRTRKLVQEPADHMDVAAPDDLSVVLGFAQMLSGGGNEDEVSRLATDHVGSTRVVSSPPPETSLLARSCNKAERERYFVFGEPLPPASSTTLKAPVASSKRRPNADDLLQLRMV